MQSEKYEWWEVVVTSARSTIKDKPRKEELVTQFHDMLTEILPVLLSSGVKQEEIVAYALEPWDIKNIRAASRWVKRYTQTEIKDFNIVFRSKDAEGWRFLLSMNPQHPDFKELRDYQDKVKKAWRGRPRFKEEKDRAKETGY